MALGRRCLGCVFGLLWRLGRLGVERRIGNEAGGAPELVLRRWAGVTPLRPTVRLSGRLHSHLLPENKRNISRPSVPHLILTIQSPFTVKSKEERFILSRKPKYKYVYRRTIEILQRARLFKANCCSKVHKAYLKLSLPISG